MACLLLSAKSDKPILDYQRQINKIDEAQARREKDEKQWNLLKQKVASVSHPFQQLKIQYANQTKGKSYSEDEDRFLLVMLSRYGLSSADTFDRIKRDIAEFPAFRFDWFLSSAVSDLSPSWKLTFFTLSQNRARRKRSAVAVLRLVCRASFLLSV